MSRKLSGVAAPELSVSSWLNVEQPLSLVGLKGRPVMIEAFQMLCPGCVSHGLPQAQRVQRMFDGTDLQVLGLHAVFEHHQVMTPEALRAFLFEYRIDFPVAIDQPGQGSPLPQTMSTYGMNGTPTKIILDRSGKVIAHIIDHHMGLVSIAHKAVIGKLRGDVSVLPYRADLEADEYEGVYLRPMNPFAETQI
jgi:thiol-disulfide isomerase/thioredoxin